MNDEALRLTLDTSEAHYWSRSRNASFGIRAPRPAKSSTVVEARIDCDQDAVWLKVRPQGDGGACHTGARSCFYRVIENGVLRRG